MNFFSKVFAILVLLATIGPASAEKNCHTALARIARQAAVNTIAQHQQDVCAGLKTNLFGISLAVDKTRQLSLRSFELCEDGPEVSTHFTVHVQCSTGDNASFHTEIDTDVTATASANLDTCQVGVAEVSANNTIVQAGFDVGNANDRLREAALKAVYPYCGKQ